MWTLALLTLCVAVAIGSSCAVEPTSPARSAGATRVTEQPPIDRLAPAHLETATFALG